MKQFIYIPNVDTIHQHRVLEDLVADGWTIEETVKLLDYFDRVKPLEGWIGFTVLSRYPRED